MLLSRDLSMKTLYMPIVRGRQVHILDDTRDEKKQPAMMVAEATKRQTQLQTSTFGL